MRTRLTFKLLHFCVLASAFCLRASAQGTAFTYQGRLDSGGSPYTGSAEFQPTLWDAAANGSQVATNRLPSMAVNVTNGLFVLPLDFGASFPGADRWLQLEVRTTIGSFTLLSPRQQVAPSPYAITAAHVVSGGIPALYTNVVTFNNADNSFTGSGAGLTALNASQLNGSVPVAALDNAWKMSGNNGTTPGSNFLGTTDDQPLEFKANGVRALRFEPNTNGAPNVIGGSPVNFVSPGAICATIAGGGIVNSLGFAYTNSVTASYGTVGGGYKNSAGGSATVSGGAVNTASGGYATVPGGIFNTASGTVSFAAGNRAKAVHSGSFVWADLQASDFSSTAENEFSVRASGGIRLSGNVQLADGYRNLSLSGGNSTGFLFGSYPYFGDGVHLGYNFYADANGTGHIINAGGGTSRVTAGYGEVVLAVGAPGAGPNTVRLSASVSGVTVNGTFNNNSDRNAKQDFAPIKPSQILDKVVHLPLSEWSYKDDPTTRHVGPMAQDFYSSFNVGTDDRHIAPIDEGGVAFAAIQGLNQKVEDLKKELNRREAENDEMKRQLAELRQLISLRANGTTEPKHTTQPPTQP